MNVIKLNKKRTGVQYIATTRSLSSFNRKFRPKLLSEDISMEDAVEMQSRLAHMHEEDKAENSNKEIADIPWVLA